MKFQGALIKHQGITFGIIVVTPSALQSITDREKMTLFGRRVFGPIPIVLAAPGSRGTIKYWGPQNIVSFLSKIPASSIQWKQYRLVV